MNAPVYIVTGFLDSGKTTFIQEMITDEGFSEGERTLLLCCEEGETEYDQKMLKDNNTILYTFEDITGKYPELEEGLTVISQTGDFKYYCTYNCPYFAGGDYIFPIGQLDESCPYYSFYFVNGCVIAADTYSGSIVCFEPPVA